MHIHIIPVGPLAAAARRAEEASDAGSSRLSGGTTCLALPV